MKHIKFVLLVVAVAVTMALFEVQVEGSQGWASALPTWRYNFSLPMMGMWGGSEKPITGYHLYLWLFSLLLTHSVFLMTKWSLKKELWALSFYVLFTTLEGALWFVFNPAFGWQSFRYGAIGWYQELWLWGLPAEYWVRIGAGVGLYLWGMNYEDRENRAG